MILVQQEDVRAGEDEGLGLEEALGGLARDDVDLEHQYVEKDVEGVGLRLRALPFGHDEGQVSHLFFAGVHKLDFAGVDQFVVLHFT